MSFAALTENDDNDYENIGIYAVMSIGTWKTTNDQQLFKMPQ